MDVSEKLRNDISNLFPGYFALVMSTGIIGISSRIAGLINISKVLFYINIISFIVLLILYVYRFLRYFSEMKNDFLNYEKSPGFLTIVAGAGVFGVQIIMSVKDFSSAEFLWLFAITMWFILMMSFFVFVITSTKRPEIGSGLNGIWLLLVVSTQAIAILGNELSGNLSGGRNALLTFDLLLFLLGCSLYLIIITLIFYRLVFFSLKPEETNHTYWIDTGAAAISVISGFTFIEKAPSTDTFSGLMPFVKGAVLMLWITATWWIPLIVVIEIWRYFVKKVQIKYSPVQWSMIFALGTYSFATLKTGQFISMPTITAAGKVFLFLALILWLLTFSGLVFSILKKE
ncbi:MAG TPA: tellurite resistance/C4-dicarboxylate transporter family protein [Bacteroidales bacterium]|nr:tellurite resistance/C4-dicarboxylate transporter family protein [Bacteroidales bacterium]